MRTALMRKLLISLFVFILPIVLHAQKNVLELSPSLNLKGLHWQTDSFSTANFIIDTRASPPLKANKKSFSITSKGSGVYLIRATPFDFMNWVKKINGHVYIDQQVKPMPDAGVINYDMTVNRINSAWNIFSGIDGSGEIVSIKENRPDTNDLDLLGKNRVSGEVSPVEENHATIMSTLAIGSGNSSYRGRGVAFNASFSSSDFIDVLPDTITYYRNIGINVQNHSYGTGVQNYYGVNARAFDQSTMLDSSLLHVFSAGNAGTSTSGQGIYAAVPGMANITGNMKMAKNILITGAMLENGSVPSYSSRGPSYDGRISPQLVAFGDDGTSGSAAIVSGTAALLQQQYKKMYNKPAGSALIRALLINSARDMGSEGPDYISGYGALDAEAALTTLTSAHFMNSAVNANSNMVFEINAPSSSSLMKITLVWNDSASPSGAARALINDIDLVVTNKQTGEQILPWYLSSYPHIDSLKKSAIRMKDTLNNIEQVSVLFPSAGVYQISVSAKEINAPLVNFSFAYQFNKDGLFKWDYPLKNDLVTANENIHLRWTSSLAEPWARLDLSRDKGLTWQLISDSVDLKTGSYPMLLPDSALELRFRMSAGPDTIETDDVVSTPARVIKYGYVCDTAVLLYWDKVKGASGYQIYRLKNDLMQKLASTTDTMFASPAGQPNYAVASIVNGREGVRGISVNDQTQNVGCYINNFIAGPFGPQTARIVLKLGTLYQVTNVQILKLSDKNKVILEINSPLQKDIATSDNPLHQGLNIYQAIVTLNNGVVIRSKEEVVQNLNSKSHIIFPNPSIAGNSINILTENVDDELAEIFDMQGKKILKFVIEEKQQQIPNLPASKGMYTIRISKNGKTVSRLSFIIL
jgi:hypothetical protein